MFAWIADNAGTCYLLLALAAGVLVAVWSRTRQTKYLLFLAQVVLIAVTVWIIAKVGQTDSKRIQDIVEEMAQGVREGNAERIFQHISGTVRFRGMGLADFRSLAEGHLKRGRAKDVEVSRFSFAERPRSGKAKVEFWAHTEQAPAPIRCEADFALEEGVWRMTTLELFIGNTTNVWPIPR